MTLAHRHRRPDGETLAAGSLFGPIPADPGRHPERHRRAARALDVIGATTLLVVLAPALGVLGLLVRLTSRGPALFRQTRIGEGGVPFEIYKFRSMYVDADQGVHQSFVSRALSERDRDGGAGDGVFKLEDDPRVTPIGRLLRRYSLDELPQLLNVVRGEMSLVGPRPAMAYEVEQYRSEELTRLAVRPGMTGLWQVSGRNTVSMDDMLALDIEYVERRSLSLDLSILARTASAVLRGDGAR